MRIQFIGHASFLVEHASVRIVVDPWLTGTAFDDGWTLLSEPAMTPADFGDVTHIWISHEHPDHFSPATLRAIDPDARARISVLYQETRDRKVVEFCTGLGFGEVIELGPGAWHPLPDGLRALSGSVPDDDSWLALTTGRETILNLNDCILRDSDGIRRLGRIIGRPIDVLFTQFSYASRVGNPGETGRHRAAAREVLDRVVRQANVLRPRAVVPFASFVWFSHQENGYLNPGMNRIEDAVGRVERETAAMPVALYPGDTWQAGEPHDNTAAIDRYRADYERIDGAPRTPTEPVDLLDLAVLAEDFRERLFEHHGRARLRAMARSGVLKPAHIYLSDHDRAAGFSFERGLAPSRRPPERCDVSLTSDALAYVFENLWGGNTLLVNGRFTAPPGGEFARFRRYLTLADQANHGHSIVDYGTHRVGDAAGRALAALRRTLRR